MDNTLGNALSAFEQALAEFQAGLDPTPDLFNAVFADTEEWTDLLTYKLVPHLAGSGCLVVAIAGGTNTGKSSIFNMLLKAELSPVVNTAAATCHPVLAANRLRRDECLEAKLVPEFAPRTLENLDDATNAMLAPDTLLVALADDLPDHMVVMDTPDVDSIDQSNWEIAEHIRAAGDVLVAVITGEKYKDERVVDFFRKAKASGRVIVPLINKANPADNFEVARKQVDEFRADVGVDSPAFAVEHDFEISRNFSRAIVSLDEAPDLRNYLEALPVAEIKERVFGSTVARFVDRADAFLAHASRVGATLRQSLDDFERDTKLFSQRYDPAPGEVIGGLFHAFVQEHRGPVRRYIGSASGAIVRGVSAVGRRVSAALRSRATLEADAAAAPEALNEMHRQAIERITRDLAAKYIDLANRIPAPVGELLTEGVSGMDVDAVAAAVVKDTLTSNNISDEFREHAARTLEAWWADNTGKRKVLEALDAVLAVVPAAIAAPIAMHTGGIGASEAAVVVAPVAEQFVARVIEYQFGDAMFDFLSPWKEEQQALLEQNLHRHLTEPCARSLRNALAPFEGKTMDALRESLDACRKI